MTRVLLFGRLRDVAGWRERAFAEAPSSVSVLRRLLAQEPGLADALEHPSVSVAVNGEIVRDDRPLSWGDEVAFLPPMSGG